MLATEILRNSGNTWANGMLLEILKGSSKDFEKSRQLLIAYLSGLKSCVKNLSSDDQKYVCDLLYTLDEDLFNLYDSEVEDEVIDHDVEVRDALKDVYTEFLYGNEILARTAFVLATTEHREKVTNTAIFQKWADNWVEIKYCKKCNRNKILINNDRIERLCNSIKDFPWLDKDDADANRRTNKVMARMVARLIRGEAESIESARQPKEG